MTCVNDKGQLSPTQRKLLEVIDNNSLSIEKISEQTGLPMFKVRSNLREMNQNGIILEQDGLYRINP
ncbi:hypothetical protein FHP05_10735 [Cerasibacillus terrae]|uniref:Winged helix-turn-helix transcriptional regulator n=1 Tax=Cerasibacillus terrae TaxID=2498845 RepID=A0A5C8NPK4_9BACI|nr:hypothetical protein [Cerasibacillus terrae]TXL63649.1 hypothetical protein FHP05_10735 [Cerasibacillus terrae]